MRTRGMLRHHEGDQPQTWLRRQAGYVRKHAEDGTMISGRSRIVAAAAALALLTPAASALAQGTLEDHFRAKTLTVIIPTTPGGDRMGNAAPFIRYFGRHIPGNPTVVPSFMPGAGGAVGINYLYNVAPRDGLTIVTPLAAAVMAQVTGEPTVKYDVSKMNWIGRTADSTQVLYVWHTVAARSFDDLKATKVLISSTGATSASTIIPYLMNHVFGTKMQVILGYSGSASFNLAVERRETDGTLTTWGNLSNNHADWVRDNKIRVLFQVALARNRDLPSVPLAVELASNDEDRALMEFMSSAAELGQSFLAPPDVPRPVIEALRRAFDATMADPDYLKLSQQAGNALNPLGGEALTGLNARTLATPRKIIDRYRSAVSGSR
jgi:tripartite-type tricarboxylate transporter receptor subunit TctC